MERRTERTAAARRLFAAATLVTYMLAGYFVSETSTDNNTVGLDKRQETAAQIENDPALLEYWHQQEITDQAKADLTGKIADWTAIAGTLFASVTLTLQGDIDERRRSSAEE